MGINNFQLMAVEITIAVIGLFLGYKCYFLKKHFMNYFMRFVIVLNIFLLINIPIRMIELQLVNWNRELVYFLYGLSVVLMTFMTFYWFLFVMKQINSKLVHSPKYIHLCLIPALCTIPLCIVNRWTGWLYYIDEFSHYHRGSIFVLQAIVSYGYFIVLVICNIVHLFIGKENINAVKKCFLSLIPTLVATAIQILYGGSYLLAGALTSGLIMYVEICLDRQKAFEMAAAVGALNDELVHSNQEIANTMRTILALSDIYHIIYDADLVSDVFTEIKAPAPVSKFCSEFSSAKECLKRLPEALFEEEDQELMKSLYNPDTLSQRMETVNSCFADGRGRLSKGWVRTSFIVTERDLEGNVTRVVMALQNVDELVKQQKKLEQAIVFENHAKEMKELFVQTAEALSGSIDAKDEYTHGHSVRVARYSRKIAQLAGMSEEECEEVYFAGLLHDVGKIGIDDAIINKAGKLNSIEFEEVKKHPQIGSEILSKVTLLPYLSLGARYHHERYDGKGYPVGLKGDDIPRIARIISVADAYDAMTSKRSYRDIIPQQKVREQMLMGGGTQFDPEIVKHMIHMIDMDFEYSMKEKFEGSSTTDKINFRFREYLSDFSEGVLLIPQPTTLKLKFKTADRNKNVSSMPSLIIFDSFDSRIYNEPAKIEEMHYEEFLSIRADGVVKKGNIRNIQISSTPELQIAPEDFAEACIEGMNVEFEMARLKDHIRIRLRNAFQEFEYIIATQDAVRYAYGSITGENCDVEMVSLVKSEIPLTFEDITRIADEISYADGPVGDIPNIQVDGWRYVSTKPVQLQDKMEVKFHGMSLPTARLIWHCPFVVYFSSDNGEINGPNYKEYALIRTDGECWSGDGIAENESIINKTLEFENWTKWKDKNKAGVECLIQIEKKGNVIYTKTYNSGIDYSIETTILKDIDKVYMALTGDQCAITNVRINPKAE